MLPRWPYNVYHFVCWLDDAGVCVPYYGDVDYMGPRALVCIYTQIDLYAWLGMKGGGG